ncbi:hypothetical protein [Massilia pseudoviolaceinigra]|uniref:hypothetical protein n=1 Tax=Massilia pseudoviolaceinigra TaxID=3057165 RepID=UPI002796B241|nr:hypothetical protein [Massilia sp. CCM 9206]MDQ1924341.1 hypothetical protein [Massilia sp. CCM 9206]
MLAVFTVRVRCRTVDFLPLMPQSRRAAHSLPAQHRADELDIAFLVIKHACFNDNGTTIYVATDIEGPLGTSDSGAPTNKLENPGAILAFKFSGAK